MGHLARRSRGARAVTGGWCGPWGRGLGGGARRRRFRLGELAPGRRPRGCARFGEASRARNEPPAGGRSETVRVTQLSPGTVLTPLPDCDGRGFALRAGAARFSVPTTPVIPSWWRPET